MGTGIEEVREHWSNIPRIQKVWFAVRRRVLSIIDFPYHTKRVKWFIQRGKRGYADCDWWNMNYYLVGIIIPMLNDLKKNKHGYPCNGHFRKPNEVCNCDEKWSEHIDEMIEAFEAARRVQEDDYYMEVSGDSVDAIRNASRKEVRQWAAMSRTDQKLFDKKIKVFTKWFFRLWD